MKKLYILGTGAATVSKYINTACVFEDADELFLVDGTGGNDIIRCFDSLQLSFNKLHHAFLSHEHTDHLLGMIWTIRMVTEYMDLGTYKGVFYLYGHKEVLDKVNTICHMLLKKKSIKLLNERIVFKPVADNEECEILKHKFVFFDIGSTKAKQYGFVMWNGDKKIVFAGDEALNEQGKYYGQEADLLLSEAFCLESDEARMHAHEYRHQTVKECAEIAQALQVKKLLIWHTEDETYGKRRELYRKEAAAYYKGEIIVPEDGEILMLA